MKTLRVGGNNPKKHVQSIFPQLSIQYIFFDHLRNELHIFKRYAVNESISVEVPFLIKICCIIMASYCNKISMTNKANY